MNKKNQSNLHFPNFCKGGGLSVTYLAKRSTTSGLTLFFPMMASSFSYGIVFQIPPYNNIADQLIMMRLITMMLTMMIMMMMMTMMMVTLS